MSIKLSLGLLLLGTIGCGAPATTDTSVTVDPVLLTAEGRNVAGLAWADGDRLVLLDDRVAPDGRSLPSRLVLMSLDGAGTTEPPRGPADPVCDHVRDRALARLPDGRVGFLRDCVRWESGEETMSLLAFDAASNETAVVAQLGDPWTAEGCRTGASSFSFRMENVDGVAGVGSGICDGIGRIANGGIEPFDLPLAEPPGANTADIWTKPCVESANVRSPTWSPDGAVLAFFVSPASRGRDGWDRMDHPYDLLLLDHATRALRRVASGFRGPMSLAWAPDGNSVAIVTDAGSVDAAEETDLWLLDTETGSRQLVSLDEGYLQGVVWSPDGGRLAGVLTDGNLDDGLGPATVVLFDRP